MIIFYLDSFPSAYFWIVGTIFVITIMLRAFINSENKRKRSKRQTDKGLSRKEGRKGRPSVKKQEDTATLV